MWAAYPFIQFMRWRLSSRQQVCDGGNQNLKEESKIKMSINPSEVMWHHEAATVFKTSIKNLLNVYQHCEALALHSMTSVITMLWQSNSGLNQYSEILKY